MKRATLAALLLLHAGLLAYGATVHSFTWDEPPHLAAGLSHWRYGQFDLYCVNPPLVRLIATAPLLFADVEEDWHDFYVGPSVRAEFIIGKHLLAANGERSFWLLTMARWALIPFSLLGGVICYRWASELYGSAAGLLATVLWCFCPNVLGHGQLITPDVAATSLGLTAFYVYWHWLKKPTWSLAIAAGIVLGLAELTKTVWIILFLLWPLIWLLWQRGRVSRRSIAQMAAIVFIALYVLNVGYLFDGSFTKLAEFRFVSEPLSPGKAMGETWGNRFADHWLGSVPVPLPYSYVVGIDLQRRDFDGGLWSFLRGEWKKGDGWWYYYLYAMAIKLPLGTLLTLAMSLVFARRYAGSWRDELFVLAPAAVILIFVSSQTGFNHHLRYVLPAFPFLFISAAKLAKALAINGYMKYPLSACVAWAAISSLAIYPHSLSYFNEIVGGPRNGHNHLGNSNADWGQDLLYLRQWYNEHPEARPLTIATDIPYLKPNTIGLESAEPPREPTAGWHILSVNQIHRRTGEYLYFLHAEPVDRIGYTMNVYHFTPKEAEQLRLYATTADSHHPGL